MVRKSEVPVAILMMTLISFSCCNPSTPKDNRCPVLVEIFNKWGANGTTEGPKGMRLCVEYVDTVFRLVHYIDESLTPAEKIKMFFGNIDQKVAARVSSSSGSERNVYQQMVEYRVTFEYVAKSKGSGNLICHIIMTPDDIAEALKKQLTPLDELKANVDMLAGTLPREIEPGFTMTGISCQGNVVYIIILVDENQKEFNEATVIRSWSKEEQAVNLADLTTGLTFWSIAARVPAKFDFHLVGSKCENELHIRFSEDEVVEYNKVVTRIIEQKL